MQGTARKPHRQHILGGVALERVAIDAMAAGLREPEPDGLDVRRRKPVLGDEASKRIERRMQEGDAGIGLDRQLGDAGPARPEALRQRFGGCGAAEGVQRIVPTVEDPVRAAEPVFRKQGGGHPVAGRHAHLEGAGVLARIVLPGHQPRRLQAREAEGANRLSRIQLQEDGGRGRRPEGSADRGGMEAECVKLLRVHGHRNPTGHLAAHGDGRQQFLPAAPVLLRKRQRRRQHDRNRVQDRFGVVRLHIDRIAARAVGERSRDDIGLRRLPDQRRPPPAAMRGRKGPDPGARGDERMGRRGQGPDPVEDEQAGIVGASAVG